MKITNNFKLSIAYVAAALAGLLIFSGTIAQAALVEGTGTGGGGVSSTQQQSNANANAACEGASLVSGGSGNCDTSGARKSINNLIADILNILSWVIGVMAVLMIIIGGMQFVISAGDPTKVAKARSTILYAVIGLIVVALAQVIVKFVLKEVAR